MLNGCLTISRASRIFRFEEYMVALTQHEVLRSRILLDAQMASTFLCHRTKRVSTERLVSPMYASAEQQGIPYTPFDNKGLKHF